MEKEDNNITYQNEADPCKSCITQTQKTMKMKQLEQKSMSLALKPKF